MDQELLDAAYSKATREHRWKEDLPKAQAILQALFPNASPGEVAQACEAAQKLRRLGNRAGGQWHDKKLTSKTAGAVFRKECPGFSTKIYDDALDQGIISNR